MGAPATSTDVRPPSMPPPRWSAGSCRCRPRASADLSCACGRASWSGCSKATDGADPEAEPRAERVRGRAGRGSGERRRWSADEARAAGLDPLTFRVRRARQRRRREPARRSRRCRRRSATRRSTPTTAAGCSTRSGYVYRIPEPPEPAPRAELRLARRTPRSRRSRASGASGWPAASRRPPARTWSGLPGADGSPTELRRPGDRGGLPAARRDPARQLLERRGRDHRRGDRRGAGLRAACWSPGDGSAPVVIHGSIDRIDRLPSGGIEVIDYKTGSTQEPEGRRREPPALDLRARLPRRAGPRHAGAGDALLHRVGARGSARPGRTSSWTRCGRTCWRGWRGCGRASSRRGRAKPCRWCDYRAMCPERAS